MSINPNEQYRVIIKALETRKHRVVYNTKTRKFKNVTSSEAKRLATKKNFITALPQLKEKVSEFIQKYTIDNRTETQLENAFKKRADKLAKRTVWFGRAKRDTAVRNLRDIRKAIGQIAKEAISSSVPPSTSGPMRRPPSPRPATPTTTKEEQVSTATTAEKTTKTPTARLVSKTEKEAPSTTAAASRSPKVEPAKKEAVPQKRYSYAHRTILKILESRKAENEPVVQLPEGVDMGNKKSILNLTEKEKTALAEKLRSFLDGTLRVKEEGKPLFGSKRKSDGLKHLMPKIQKKIGAYEGVENSRSGTQRQIKVKEEELRDLERDLATMQQCEEEKKPFIYVQTRRDETTKLLTAKTEISYPSSAEVEGFLEELENLDEEEKKILLADSKAKSLEEVLEKEFPANRRLSGLIANAQQVIAKKKEEIRSLKVRLKKYEQQLSDIEKEKSGDIEYKEFQEWMTDREDLTAKFRNVIGWIEESLKGKEKKKPEGQKAKAAEIRKKISWMQSSEQTKKALGTAASVVLKSPFDISEIKSLQTMEEENAALTKKPEKEEEAPTEEAGPPAAPPPPPPPPPI